MTFPMPRRLAVAAEKETDERHRAWFAMLPAIVDAAAQRWKLEVGEPYEPGGVTAWVAPARNDALGDIALKVAWKHPEASGEAEGLREWAGDGAVHVYDVADMDDTVVLLLERCVPGTTLATEPETEQDTVVTGLLQRLWRPPAGTHPFRTLTQMCDEWADEFEQKVARRGYPVDPGIARSGIELFRELPRTGHRDLLLCTDLHAENVLRAQRQTWLVIDPKPHVGDPTYDVLQHFLNCPDRLAADPDSLIERVAALADLDASRVRLWLFARCVQESPGWPSLRAVAEKLAP